MNNVPKLRFKEFSEEWEAKLFGDIVTNKSKKYNPEKESISYKCIELEHLSTESGQLLGYVDSLNLGSIKNKFNKNNVLFGKLRPYLKKYLLAPFDGVCSSEIWVLNGINITNFFLYYLVQSDYFIGLANQSSGSKMPRADWNIIENSIFFIPQKQEQEKIASFLTSVDTKIEQITKKEELLQQYKKGVMQKIFNQEIRFKADDGSEFCEWEEKKLEDLIERTSTGLNPRQNFVLGSGLNYYVTIKNIKNGNLDFSSCEMIDDEALTLIHRRSQIQKNDIIMSSIGNIGESYLIKENPTNWDINESVFMLRPNSKVVPKYLYYTITGYKAKQYFENNSTGSSFTSIKLNTLKIMPVTVSCLEEQTKIANFLSEIDFKIEQVKKYMKSIKDLKKTLLKELII